MYRNMLLNGNYSDEAIFIDYRESSFRIEIDIEDDPGKNLFSNAVKLEKGLDLEALVRRLIIKIDDRCIIM